MFGINGWEIIALAVVALLVFGPDRLPKAAADAGRLFRQLRLMIANARRDIGESLGPEFKDFDVTDLNPRQLVRKHLLDPAEEDDDPSVNGPGRSRGSRDGNVRRDGTGAGPSGTPYDADAT